MSNALRKVKRQELSSRMYKEHIKHKNLSSEWKQIHTPQQIKQKKKKRFFDNVKNYLHMFSFMKEKREESANEN